MQDNLTRIAPQARYHSSRLDQIDRLIHAAEADEDIAYLARLLALCSLPRTNPGNRKEYVRRNGPFTLALTAGFDNKLPFGYIARLLLAWVCTEAVRTQSQDLTLGKTLSDFMRVVGIDPAGASYAVSATRCGASSLAASPSSAKTQSDVHACRPMWPTGTNFGGTMSIPRTGGSGEAKSVWGKGFLPRSSAIRCRWT